MSAPTYRPVVSPLKATPGFAPTVTSSAVAATHARWQSSRCAMLLRAASPPAFGVDALHVRECETAGGTRGQRADGRQCTVCRDFRKQAQPLGAIACLGPQVPV